MTKVLVIDDNSAILNFLNVFLLQSGGFEPTTLQDSRKAYDLLKKEKFDVLLLDMDMPHVSGLDILKFINKNSINTVTIVLTGVEDVDLAISAMKLGTFDYMLKPIDEEKLLDTIQNALRNIQIEQVQPGTPGVVSRDDLKHKEAFEHIITDNEEMIRIFRYVEKFAVTDNSVLIWGESGSGKELIAKAIHQISKRKNKQFIAVNAGTFAHELFASEFFGHEKGAFTGADKDKTGFIEEANGGTLFLDEIGELSLPIQVKLLRVLQEEEFYKLGSTKNIKVDVRIIAATNKNLFEEIQNGNFRKDLFFRLNINSINLPPLRERPEDIPVLANYFLEKFNEKYQKNVKGICPALLNCLKNYSFPGNVRELMNIINSAIIIETGAELRRTSLPHFFHAQHCCDEEIHNSFKPGSLQEIEKDHINKVLNYTDGNRTKAADILGISRVSLLAKIKKYELE